MILILILTLLIILILLLLLIIIIIIIIANITMKQLKRGHVIIFREPKGTFVSADLNVIQVPIQCPPSRLLSQHFALSEK